MNSKKFGRPIVLTVTVLLGLIVFSSLYNHVRGPFEAKMAVQQADGTDSGAVVGGFFARANVPTYVWMGGLLVIGVSWARYYGNRKLEGTTEGSAAAVSPKA